MIGGSFLFLKEKFPFIYSDCERMEKNLVEADGVETIMLAGRICERVTRCIFEIEGFEITGNQFKRIQKLYNEDILPFWAKDKLNQVRMLRNNVFHHDVDGLSKSYTRTYGLNNGAGARGSGSLKSYGFDDEGSKGYAISKSLDELASAKKSHLIVFNILVWFYSEYGGDKSFTRPVYKIGKRSSDVDLLIRFKQAVLDDGDFREILIGAGKDNRIIRIINELRQLESVGSSRDDFDSDVVYKENKDIKIRKADKPYSECLGVDYDDELFMWRASYGDKSLGLFNTSKEAYVAREVYLNSIPIPQLNSDGNYSSHVGVSFSRVNKMWTVSARGVIVGYCPSEKDAVLMRDSYYKKHGLKIKYSNKKRSSSFNDGNTNSSNKNSNTYISHNLDSSKHDKNSKFDVRNNTELSVKSSDNSEFGVDSKFNKMSGGKSSKNNKKSSKNKKKSQVHVVAGRRVGKNSKKVKNQVKVNRRASKYNGVYYEEGLFMWSAEVDGKELGLFASEEEARDKREEYIKSMN